MNKKVILMFAIIGLLLLSACSKEVTFFDDKFKCDLILEQRVACYKGCQHYLSAQRQLDNYTDVYDSCADKCEEQYYTEFNDDGSLKLCRYWDYESTTHIVN